MVILMEASVAVDVGESLRFDAESGLLEYADQPYVMTMSEIRSLFVAEAPFREERELLFSVLSGYLRQTRRIVPVRRIWMDGSFVSLRPDRPPADVDVLLLVNEPTAKQKRELVSRGLLTMSEVSVTIAGRQMPTISKLAPYGGLVDSYYVDDSHSTEVEHWEMQWSTPKGDDGNLDFTRTKGFVEVIEEDD